MQKKSEIEICVAQISVKLICPWLHHFPLRSNGLFYATDDLLSSK